MPERKTIAVVGATGNQGSSVVKTFANLPDWTVRALTRDPSSSKAQALASSSPNITLVKGDLSDPSSLATAFDGVHAIFLNTDFWGTFHDLTSTGTDLDSAAQQAFDAEVEHGKNAVHAASKIPTLERFVYSALGPMSRASGGKYHRTFHWEAKAAVVDYIFGGEMPDLAARTSLVYLGAYNTNALIKPGPDPTAPGEYVLAVALPAEFRMPIIDPKESTGVFVRALVEDEEPGTKVLAYDRESHLTIRGAAQVWSRVTGKKVSVKRVTVKEMHKTTGAPMEVLETLDYLDEFGYMAGVEGWIEPGQLKNRAPRTRNYEEWLKGRAVEDNL
jgi:hypothetical protein